MRNKALVFDLDDTLYAEINYLKSAYRVIAKKIEPQNGKQLYFFMLELYKEKKNVFEFLLDRYDGLSQKKLFQWYRYHKPSIQLFDGVLECLKILESTHKFAIITDGRSITQRNKLQALGIMDLLSAVVISEEIGTEKPHINNFLKVQDILQCESYIYVGDNPKKDFIIPNKLGWNTVCLLNQGNNIHEQNFEQDSNFLPKNKVASWKEMGKLLLDII